MTFDHAELDNAELRRIRERGVTIVLHLNVDPADPDGPYQRDGGPGRVRAVVVQDEGLAGALFTTLGGYMNAKLAADVQDRAALAVCDFLEAGIERQTLMGPLIYALAFETWHAHAHARHVDPLDGYAARVELLEEAKALGDRQPAQEAGE